MAAVKRSLNVGVVGLGPVGTGIAASIATKARSQVYLQLFSRSLSRAVALSDRLGVDGASCAMRCHGGGGSGGMHNNNNPKLDTGITAASTSNASSSLAFSPYTSISRWSDVLFVCPPVSGATVGATSIARDMLLDGTLAWSPDNNNNNMTAISSSSRVGGRRGGGVLHASRPGQYILCHASLDAQTAAECRMVAAQRGAFFYDAPFVRNDVFLNATKVKNTQNNNHNNQQQQLMLHDYTSFLSGQHTLLLSGGTGGNLHHEQNSNKHPLGGGKSVDDDSALQRLRALLPWFADHQVYFGSTAGAASAASLWLDAMATMHTAVAVEGLRLWDTLQQQRTAAAASSGVDPDAAVVRDALWSALSHSDASSRVLDRRGRLMQHLIDDPTASLVPSSLSPSSSTTQSQDRFFKNNNRKPNSTSSSSAFDVLKGGVISVRGMKDNLNVLQSDLFFSTQQPQPQQEEQHEDDAKKEVFEGSHGEEEETIRFPLLTWATDALSAAEQCGWGAQDVAVLAQVPNETIMQQSHQQQQETTTSSSSFSMNNADEEEREALADKKAKGNSQQQQKQMNSASENIEFY